MLQERLAWRIGLLPLLLLPTAATAFSIAQDALRSRNLLAGVPVPSAAQLNGALRHNFVVFEHFSMCTFKACQWNLATGPAEDTRRRTQVQISRSGWRR